MEWHPVLETSLNTVLLTFNNLAFWLKELFALLSVPVADLQLL